MCFAKLHQLSRLNCSYSAQGWISPSKRAGVAWFHECAHSQHTETLECEVDCGLTLVHYRAYRSDTFQRLRSMYFAGAADLRCLQFAKTCVFQFLVLINNSRLSNQWLVRKVRSRILKLFYPSLVLTVLDRFSELKPFVTNNTTKTTKDTKSWNRSFACSTEFLWQWIFLQK